MAACSSSDSSYAQDDETKETNFSSESDQEENKTQREERIQKLRKICHEREVQLKLIQRITEVVQLSIFLNEDTGETGNLNLEDNEVVPDLSAEQVKHIQELLKEKESLQTRKDEITKRTRNLEAEVSRKKITLKALIQNRNDLWKTSAEILEREATTNAELQDTFNEPDSIQRSTYCRKLQEKLNEYEDVISVKLRRTVKLAKVLKLLICFSGVKWAYDPSLLEIVLNMGKLLNTDLSSENVLKLSKLVDDVINKLNSVKI